MVESRLVVPCPGRDVERAEEDAVGARQVGDGAPWVPVAAAAELALEIAGERDGARRGRAGRADDERERDVAWIDLPG